VVPVSTPLVRLYSEYMHAEYGGIDSDYVFVNLFGGRIGAAMTYPAVHQLIGRIAAATIPGGCARRLPGRTCAPPPPCPHPRERSPATASTPAATARPATPSTGS